MELGGEELTLAEVAGDEVSSRMRGTYLRAWKESEWRIRRSLKKNVEAQFPGLGVWKLGYLVFG